MIFNEMNAGISHDYVQESPYELGIGGALMHVYENECNYNAIMKAAALSEMKYYNETGGDLFVQEAGAFSNLIERVKDFFKKAIEKIKSIAKKFFARFAQFTMKDKDFVKKYSKDILRRNLKDFEYDGYKFEAIQSNHPFKVTSSECSIAGLTADSDSDAVNDLIEANRGRILGKNGKFTESEYRDELKEILYGDKESFTVDIRKWFTKIENTKDYTKNAEKAERDSIKAINDLIKALERTQKDDLKVAVKNTPEGVEKTNAVNKADKEIQVYRAFVNDLTVCFGAYTKALVDCNRQAKAICVKALSYKHESATVYEGGYNDIFAGVEII